jgi:ADP-ribose pyrophosphatase YjhB (NUDIX family)
MKVGACTAVFQHSKILLTKRKDFEVWCLPGGHVDEGESIAQAAVRETAEETGLEVELTRLVGLYAVPKAKSWVNLLIVFAAKPVGGQLRAQADEVLALDYFAADEIPENLLWGHRQRIKDAFNGRGGGTVWVQNPPFDPVENRQELYQMVDSSGLSGRDFYLQHFGLADHQDDRLELP